MMNSAVWLTGVATFSLSFGRPVTSSTQTDTVVGDPTGNDGPTESDCINRRRRAAVDEQKTASGWPVTCSECLKFDPL